MLALYWLQSEDCYWELVQSLKCLLVGKIFMVESCVEGLRVFFLIVDRLSVNGVGIVN